MLNLFQQLTCKVCNIQVTNRAAFPGNQIVTRKSKIVTQNIIYYTETHLPT